VCGWGGGRVKGAKRLVFDEAGNTVAANTTIADEMLQIGEWSAPANYKKVHMSHSAHIYIYVHGYNVANWRMIGAGES